jgi:membrane protease YdiL (CAAX protease family)
MPVTTIELVAQLALVIGMLYLAYWLKKYEPKLAKKGPVGKKKAAWLRKWFLNYKLKLGNPIITIIAPVVLIVLVSRFWVQVTPPEGDIWLVFLIMVVLQPLFEEIAYRGWLFGAFITRAEAEKGFRQTMWFVSGFFIQTMVFMLMHLHGFNVFLYVGGGLFGLLFYLSKRNLVPCTVAHIATNLMVWWTLLPIK